MTTFAARRVRNITILVIIAVPLLVVHWIVVTASLVPTSFWTGWTLLGLVLFLTAYNLRKKIAVVPLLTSATWLQLHVYAGLLSIAVFLAHIGYAVPSGGLDRTLGGLFALVAASGVVGLAFTRLLPPRLNRRGENLVFERIPAARRRIQEQAESIALRSVDTGNVTTLSDLYRNRLRRFFDGPRHFWSHLAGSTRPRYALLGEMEALRRYLSADDRACLDELLELVRLKDDLDYRSMSFRLLKGWLLAHIPLTYGMLLFAVPHVILVHAFSGGVW